VNELFSLQGKVALVTGASEGGLGEYMAAALAQQGATLAIAASPGNTSGLLPTAERCGPQTTMHYADVSNEADVENLIAEVVERHGRLDILINSAGRMLRKAYDETSLAEFENIVKINLSGTWLLNREAGKVMAAQKSGRIINLSTVYAERVGPIPESAYYASKAAIVNVTRSMASELGPSNVTVNCIAPAVFYPTKMTAPLGETPEKLEWFKNRTMLQRLGNPETDIAGPAIFLASDASNYVTGQVLYVDGGWSAW